MEKLSQNEFSKKEKVKFKFAMKIHEQQDQLPKILGYISVYCPFIYWSFTIINLDYFFNSSWSPEYGSFGHHFAQKYSSGEVLYIILPLILFITLGEKILYIMKIKNNSFVFKKLIQFYAFINIFFLSIIMPLFVNSSIYILIHPEKTENRENDYQTHHILVESINNEGNNFFILEIHKHETIISNTNNSDKKNFENTIPYSKSFLVTAFVICAILLVIKMIDYCKYGKSSFPTRNSINPRSRSSEALFFY